MSGQANSVPVPAAAPRAVPARQNFLQRAQEDYNFFQEEVSTITSVVDKVNSGIKVFRQGFMGEPLGPDFLFSSGSILPRNRVHALNLLGRRIHAAAASGYDDELYVTYEALKVMTQNWLYSDSLKARIDRTWQDLHTERLARQSRYPLLAAFHRKNVDLQADVKRLQGELQTKTTDEAKAVTEAKTNKGLYDQEVKAKSGLQEQNARLQAALLKKDEEIKQISERYEREAQAKSGLQEQNARLQAALLKKDQEIKQISERHEKEAQARSGLQEQNAFLSQSLEARNRELEEAKVRHVQELKAQSEMIVQRDKTIAKLMMALEGAIGNLNEAKGRLDQAEERLKQFGDVMLAQKEQQAQKRFDPKFFKGDGNGISSNSQPNNNEKTEEKAVGEEPRNLVRLDVAQCTQQDVGNRSEAPLVSEDALEGWCIEDAAAPAN